MKTKYKILIVSIMVLSILSCFMITSFAATTTDIVYNGNTYTYNTIISSNTSDTLQIWNYNNIYYVANNNERILIDNEYDYVFLIFSLGSSGSNNAPSNYSFKYSFVYNGETLYEIFDTPIINVYIDGTEYKYAFNNTGTYNSSLTNINTTDVFEYDVWQNLDFGDSNQVNLLNDTQPNPLDKVDSFLTYLSASLNKLTTMIITNQILILFIVAVPVVSFVIGSFKRIKDSGRV